MKKNSRFEQNQALQARQQEEENTAACRSGRGDIESEQPYPDPQIQKNGFVGFTGTNGLVYQQLISPTAIAQRLSAVPYYGACLGELGVGNRDYIELQKQIFSHRWTL